MKRFLFPVLILVSAVSALAQTRPVAVSDLSEFGVRIEPDRRLIVVTLALEAAGLQTPLTARGEQFREKFRDDLKALNPDLRQKMKFFVDQYKKRYPKASDAEVVAPFISMAYTLGPVPDLAEPTRATDLPGDLLEVLDFSPLVRQFYRSGLRIGDQSLMVSARVEELYKEYQAIGDAMRPSTARMIRSLVDYLHTRPQTVYTEQVKTEVQKGKSKTEKLTRIETRERERRFYLVPDAFALAGTINFRNIGDDYYAIVPPDTEIDESEVRRAYLQFLLDPIVLANAKDVAAFRDGIKALLDEARKTNPAVSPDIFLAVSRSLIAAVDAKETAFRKYQEATAEARRNAGRPPLGESTDAQGRKVVRLTEDLNLVDGRFFVMPRVDDEVALKLSEAYEKGAVLGFYFAQQMKGIEESQFDIAGAFRDMVLSLDPAREAGRLAENAEARKRAQVRREELRRTAMVVVENPLTRRLTEIEPLIKSQNYTEAEGELKKLLDANPGEPRIFYNLGRVKALSAAVITDIEARNALILEAKIHFENVLRSATEKTDQALISLTYVSLARLYEYYDQNEYAIKIYEAAIRIGDVRGGGYQEAVAARDRLLKQK